MLGIFQVTVTATYGYRVSRVIETEDEAKIPAKVEELERDILAAEPRAGAAIASVRVFRGWTATNPVIYEKGAR